MRATLLRRALAPCAANEASNCVLRLFGLIPQSDAGADVLRQIADYGRVLCVEPLWAIEGACRRAINEGVKFRPSAPDLLAKARLEARQARAEVDEIEKLFSAQIFHGPSKDARDRVGELYSDLRKTLDEATRGKKWKPRPVEEVAAWSHQTPVELSSASKAAVGLYAEAPP
jgi:hypothetical protein